MVESEDHQSDQGAEKNINSIQKQARGAFLKGDHIKEAVDQFRSLMGFKNLQRDSRESKRQIGRQAHKDTALD